MKDKKQEKESEAFCDKCFKKINEKKDDYHKVQTFLIGKLVVAKFIHKSCSDEINNQRLGGEKGIEMAKNMMTQARSMLKALGIEPKEVVEIR